MENTSDNRVKTTIDNEIQSARVEDVKILAEMVANKKELVSESGNTYYFKRILSVDGGEGAVVVCQNEKSGEVAVKVYLDVKNVSFARREKIIRFTNSDNAEKYVLPIIDFGFIELEDGTSNYYEVQPLCNEGDLLSKGKCSYDELIKIIGELNEGLHFIHESGFLHMDIKPENIYRYNNRYVFGDFGITRELKEGQAVTQITHVGKTISGTPGYQAPEVLYGTVYYKLTSKTDYYSLAVTLASLYIGKFVFSQDGEFDAVQFQESAQASHIDLENKEDERTLLLQNLIDGLFQFDKNKRFDYEDVCKWLQNPFYKGTLENQSGNTIKWSSPFQGSSKKELLYTERELFDWIAINWEDAKNRLYRGDIERHFQINNEAFVKETIENIREMKYPNIDINGDSALFETCMLIYSETDTPFVWKNRSWDNMQILADDIMTSENPLFYAEIFEKRLISLWLEKIGLLANDDKQLSLIKDIEDKAQINSFVACFWFAFLYASKQEIEFENNSFDNVIELIEKVMDSPADFYKENGYLSILMDLKRSYRLFGFMCSGGVKRVGCAEYVYAYLKENVSDLCQKVHLLFVLFEQIGIALEQSDFVNKIQSIYIKYGPYGDVAYVHNLVKNTDFFCSDVKEGIAIIDEIKKQNEVQLGTISAMGKELIEVKKLTDKMYENMQNNPLLAQAGIYKNKIIKCRNLQGYYLYRYLNKVVPLGYKNLIERDR